MKGRFALVLALAAGLGLVSTPVRAGEGPSLGGHVKGFAFQQLAAPYALERAGSRLQLELSGGREETATYFAAVDFELDSRLLSGAGARGEGFDIFPVEMWLNLSRGPVELRLGQQFIFWGRTSWVNPTDVLTAWDYVHMASEVEDYRLAPLAARLNWYLVGELKLDLVWVPLFTPNRLPAPAEMGGLPVTENAPLTPDPLLRNGEFGVRLSHAWSALALDWAVCVYRGFDKNPAVDMAPIFAPGAMPPVPVGMSWTRRYERLTLVGADFAKALGAFVLKGEGALKLGEDKTGDDPKRRNSRLEYVLGLDWTASEDFSLGAQYAGRHLLDYSRDAEVDALSAMGPPPPFVEEGTTHEVSLQMNLKLLPEVGLQVIGLYNATYQDFFVLGFVWWDVADALKAYAGTVAFGGRDEHTPFGRQRSFSRAFLEVKYSF